ncbi:MAG TPA: glycosyltransferase [Terriglobales bacterium]|nr:glycosyltransferase [Terriglobales bacterium]
MLPAPSETSAPTTPVQSSSAPEAVSTGTPPPVFLMINSFETGGSERQFAALARSLDRAAFDVHLGCIQNIGPLGEGFRGVAQFGLGGSLYRMQSVKTRLRLARQLRRGDIAIAHAFDFYTNLTLVPAARLARVPVVIGSQRQLGDLLTPAQSWAQAAVLRLCDRVVCNSQAAADGLLKQGISKRKLVVIGNGLPDSAFAETVPALARRSGVLRVGMIARMNARYKNHHGFLSAAAKLAQRQSNLEFVLVGNGPLRTELENYARDLGIADRVCFLGDRQDIPAILASLDVSLVPSDSESLSNVILESMAAGVPVVATAVGGTPELLNDRRGVLVPPNDENALSIGVEQLLKDGSLRQRMGSVSREFARANFTLDAIRSRYQDLYRELLEQKNWRPATRKARRGRSNSPIRVALVAPSLRYVGGQAVQADLFLRSWKGDRDVSASFVAVDPALPSALRWAERVPGLRTMLREPLYFFSLWRNLRDVDIAHIFSASYWSFLLAPVPAWAVARLRGKKTIINYRSGEARDHLQRFRSAVPVLKRTDRLVVPSGYLVDVFREFGLCAEVVPNVVDLSQFCFRLRNPLRPRLVCTRGFHSYYCIDAVVRAFAEVQKAYPDAHLDLVGGGELEDEVRALVRDLKLSGVNFAGVASRQEIGSFYDRADIFINASRLDNMPVSVLEAFASGTPVVTTAPESMPYIVEHERTGLLSEVGDASKLAQNVIRLLRDSELANRLATNAYEESRRYHWSAVREQWLSVYRSLISQEEHGLVSAAGRV